MDRLRGLAEEGGGPTSPRRRRTERSNPDVNASIEAARQRMARGRGLFSAEERTLIEELTGALRANTATLREVYDLGPAADEAPAEEAQVEDAGEDEAQAEPAEEAPGAAEDEAPAEDKPAE